MREVSTNNLIYELDYFDIIKWKGDFGKLEIYYLDDQILTLYSAQYIDILNRLYNLCLIQANKLK